MNAYRMKRNLTMWMVLVAAAAAMLLPGPVASADEKDGWVSLFDGKTLDGWRASENKDSFRVEDGLIIADGPRSHLFYEGPVNDATFKNFEIRMDVKTFPRANSGVFFHTRYQETGWPNHGYEVQINATHGDRIKTGSIYAVKNIMDNAPHEDNKWFNLHFSVIGKQVVVKVDGEVVLEFTEPDGVEGTKRLSQGTVALQAHDPNSVIHFRNIHMRVLEDEIKPLKALYVTGGGWHDYERQKTIVTEGMSARANVQWEIEHEAGKRHDFWPSRFDEENWMEGFDVIFYNFCITGVPGPEHVERLVKMHEELQVPAVMLHGSMHAFRTGTREWFKCCGARSHSHERHRPFKVEVLEAKHPIMIGFPKDGWQTPNGELYEISEIYENTTPLARAYGKDTEKYHEVIWTNDFRGTRVFATTIGHHNETMEDPVYLDYVSRGMLWAVNKLDSNGKPMPGYEGKGVAVGAGEFDHAEATKLTGRSIGTEGAWGNTDNTRDRALDGNPNTFFDAPGGDAWVGLDLGKAKVIKGVRFAPRSSHTSRMHGGVIQGANQTNFSDAVDLYTIRAEDADGVTSRAIDDEQAFRYVRYVGPSGGHGNISVLEFYSK